MSAQCPAEQCSSLEDHGIHEVARMMDFAHTLGVYVLDSRHMPRSMMNAPSVSQLRKNSTSCFAQEKVISHRQRWFRQR